MDYPATDCNICPSCGVEFGIDDAIYGINELRQSWFDRGMTWTSQVIPRPADYRPLDQMKNFDVVAVSTQSTKQLDNANSTEPQVMYRKPVNGVTYGVLRYRIA